MLDILETLGMIGGNVIGIPGILGLALGMTTRNFALGALMGAIVGLVETLVFVKFHYTQIEMQELTISILVGVAAGLLGTAIRHKGTIAPDQQR